MSLPTLSKTTGTPSPSVSSRTRVGDVLARVEDDVVAAVGAGQLGLRVARDGADHGQAQQLGPLGDDQADAAGGGVQQDGVAGLQPGEIRRSR